MATKFNESIINEDGRWTGLYRAGGMAAYTMLGLMIVQVIIFIVWPPPETVSGYFVQFQDNRFIGLLNLDLLYIITNVLMIVIYTALYPLMRRTNESMMLLALVLGLTGIAIYFTSNIGFEMLALSNQYADATTEIQRVALLATGETLLALYKGTAFAVYYILSAVALLLFSIVMLRCSVFDKLTAYFALLAGILMLVPSTAGTIGLIFSLASLVPWAIWLVLFGRRMFRLTRAG